VRAARTRASRTDPAFRLWLRHLRESAGLSQEELAQALGTDRRNIHRWEVEGHDPAGTVLLRLLTAVGVTVTPAVPGDAPKAVNAELRDVQAALGDARDAASGRHDDLVQRLEGHDEQLRLITARLEEIRARRE
jgi:transcriptional regulator with XRE-family HTH domain